MIAKEAGARLREGMPGTCFWGGALTGDLEHGAEG